MGVLSNAIRMGASQPSVSGDYQVERSLRFDATDVTSLKRTPSEKGNQRKWTWAGWVKRSDIAQAAQSLFTVYASSNDAGYINLYFHNHHLRLSGWNTSYRETNAEFKDTSAWYHIVCAVDTTISNTYPDDRIKFYVNGKQITDWLTKTSISQNTEFPINKANNHGIGTNVSYTNATHKFNGYLADVHFIDGLQLTPMAFGSFDSSGVFNPKEFAPAAPNDGTTWSGKVSTDNGSFSSDAPAVNAFNGRGASTWAAPANGGADKWIAVTNLGFEGSSEVTVSSWTTKLEINGDILYTSAGSDSTLTFNITDFDSIKLYGKDNGSKAALYYLKVDGVELVDGQVDATTRNNVNNDTTWSSSCSGSTESWGTHAMAFDGTGANYAYATAGGSITFTPSSAIPFTSLRAWITRDANGGTFTLNGSTTYDPPTSGVSWVNIASNGTLTSLAWNRASSGSIGIGVKAIEIDGHVLIDDSDDNSCHFKFNDISTNAALGTDSFSNGNWTVSNLNAKTVDYEGMMSGIGNWDDGDVSRLFDGSTSTGSEFNSGGGNAVFTPNPAISYSGNLEIYTGRTTAMAVELNDSGTDISYVGAGWTTLDTGGGTLSKMEFKNGSAGNQRFAAIRVDGSILTQIGGDKVDSFVDSPSSYGTDSGLGGQVRGNYCTMNPLDTHADVDLEQGNLYVKREGAWKHARGTWGLAAGTGKYYFEAESIDDSGTPHGVLGIATKDASFTESYGGAVPQIHAAYVNATSTGGMNIDGSWTGNVNFTAGNYIGVAVDTDNKTVRFYRNGTIDSAATSWDQDGPYFPWVGAHSTGWILNFGQRAFKYAAPSGYKALCTQNLPDTFSGDNVNNPSKYFDVKLYTGTGSALTLPANFSTEFLISKRRSWNAGPITYDKTSGFSKCLQINSTNALANVTMVSATTESSYTVGTDASINADGSTYVNWIWDASTSFSNSSGTNSASVASEGYYNADAGFAIVKYTGGGYAAGTGVYHPLGAVPELIIHKRTDGTSNWETYTTVIDGSYDQLLLNKTDAKTDSSQTAPTSTLFNSTWSSGQESVTFVWAPIKGYSAFGKYEGNGGTQQLIHTGFAPRFVIIKRTDSSTDGNWYTMDRLRQEEGNDEIPLFLNESQGESSAANYNYIDPWTANGFGVKGGDSLNGSGKTYFYAAFAEHPMKTSRGR